MERGYSPPPRKRIKAPVLDTAELIEANALTLMGRLTNPAAQRLWSMFPFLSNRWNLKGKAIGSDLGKGCFQFKFDLEEDLQKVLDNRPYHYDQWMIILQRWEPVISDSFPSMIPFWIELQGLPKHYWQPEMLTTIGEELGEILDMEITSAYVKLRILINGLQPLIKETVVEFPDGKEALVFLEYKQLKTHCQHCLRLSHETKLCPGLAPIKTKALPPTSLSQDSASRGGSRNYYTPKDNFRAPRSYQQGPDRSFYSQEATNSLKRKLVDQDERDKSHSVGRSIAYPAPRKPLVSSKALQDRHFNRPDHSVRSRNSSDRRLSRDNLQWRARPTCPNDLSLEASETSRTRRPPLERNTGNPDPQTPPPPIKNSSALWRQASLEATSPPLVIPSKDQVLGELREVTVQYLTCADPTESAARRQRVIQGEAKNLMSNTADQIIEAAVALAPSLHNPNLDLPFSKVDQLIATVEPPPSKESIAPTKRGRGRPPQAKPLSKPTPKLAGVKSQKRNLVQGSPKKTSGAKSLSKQGNSGAGPSRPQNLPGPPASLGVNPSPSTNSVRNVKDSTPKISLFPASKKTKMDFQNPSTPLP